MNNVNIPGNQQNVVVIRFLIFVWGNINVTLPLRLNCGSWMQKPDFDVQCNRGKVVRLAEWPSLIDYIAMLNNSEATEATYVLQKACLYTCGHICSLCTEKCQ